MGKETANLGTLGTAGYSLAPGHSINVLTMYTHSGESIASVVSGLSETDGMNIDSTRLEFVERGLGFGQLIGSHRLSSTLELGWQGNLAHSSRDEKDTRDI